MFEIIHQLGIFPQFIIIVISLWLIIKSADFFVKGASSISLKLGISAFVVGLTVVAIGTSAPELFVNIIAATSGATDLTIGNIFGSNIAGILLGLGIAAIITPLSLKSKTVWKELPFSLMGAFVVLILGMDVVVNHIGTENIIGRSDGIVLLLFFIIFIVYTFGLNKTTKNTDDEKIDEYSWLKSILYILGGVMGLVFFGNLTVESAIIIASQMGLSQNLIGLTIVAAGTSLPEITTAIIAVRKNQMDLVIGGIVGTIIFNIFFALGVTAVIAPLPFQKDNIIDGIFLMFISIIFFSFMFIGKKRKLEKWQGWSFVLLYIGYITFTVLREVL